MNHFLDTVPVPEKVENPKLGLLKLEWWMLKNYYSIERGVVKAVDGIV